MSKLKCCRLKCGEQFTDNWYGKSKVLPLANHDSRSFFNRQFSAIWFAEHCDMKSALLCLTCASNLKSWFELEWGSIASDSYSVSFDGRSAAIIYRSFEAAGESQMPLSELRVSSNDAFRNNFEMRCYVSGVMVSPRPFLEGQGCDFDDEEVETGDETMSTYGPEVLLNDNGAGIDSKCVLNLKSATKVLEVRDLILGSKVCPGAILSSSFDLDSAAGATNRVIQNTRATTTALPPNIGRAKVVKEQASGYIPLCSDSLYSLKCPSFSACPAASSSSSSSSSAAAATAFAPMTMQSCDACAAELKRETYKHDKLKRKEKKNEKTNEEAAAEQAKELERLKDLVAAADAVSSVGAEDFADAAMAAQLDELFIAAGKTDAWKDHGAGEVKELTILHHLLKDVLRNMELRLKGGNSKQYRYSPLTISYCLSLCSNMTGKVYEQFRHIMGLPTAKLLKESCRQYSLMEPGANAAILDEFIIRCNRLYPGKNAPFSILTHSFFTFPTPPINMRPMAIYT